MFSVQIEVHPRLFYLKLVIFLYLNTKTVVMLTMLVCLFGSKENEFNGPGVSQPVLKFNST